MAPKKKPAAKDGEEDLFEEFIKRYNKNMKEYDVAKIPDVQEIMEADEEVLKWNFSRAFDAMGFRILWHSVRQAGYNNIQAIRVWKCDGGDESVRSVCYYLDSQPPPAVVDLQFLDNGLTELGCEFLGRTLGPNANTVVNLLRLDYNQFGSAGVEMLSRGLSQNATLRHLSLQYCGIGEDGGQYLAHILMFVRCAIDKLELRGNYLGNKGIVDVFHGARRCKSLTELDVFDNKFSDTQEVIDTLRDLFANNQKLAKYNLGGNAISDAGASQLVQGMVGHAHLSEVYVPERCSMKTFEALEFQLNSSKGKKGKKGKKK